MNPSPEPPKVSGPKECCGAYGRLHSTFCTAQTPDELREQVKFYHGMWLDNQKSLMHDRKRAFHEVNSLRGKLAILKHENNKLRRKWVK